MAERGDPGGIFDLIKKSFLASLGAAVVTRNKVQDALNSLVEQGKISTEEADKLAEDLVESGRSQWSDVQAKFSDSVRKALDNMDIGSKKEFQDLVARVENLEKRMVMLEASQIKTEEAVRTKSEETGHGA